MLSGDNSILQKATDAKQTSERAEAKEQAQMDIMAYIANKTANHQDASLDDNKIKDILTDKSYVKEAGDTSFTTKKGEYVIPYSELYQTNNVTPSQPETPTDKLATLEAKIKDEDGDCMIDENGNIIPINVWNYEIIENDICKIVGIEEDEDTYNAYNDEVLENGELKYNIPVYIKTENTIYRVTELGDAALFSLSGLKNIIIPNNITKIGNGTFHSCMQLVSVTIPNSVTSIGNGAFRSCRNLENIIIPNSVNSIESGAFGNSGLKNIVIPNSVTYLGENAFDSCSQLENITLSNNISSIKECTFTGCSKLSNITIPSSVENIEYAAFWACNKIESITIPNNVTQLGLSVFGDWTSSQIINIQFKQNELPSGWNSSWNGNCSAQINYAE